jgi:hypothetical protein
VLCDLEGNTRKEAAAQLKIPEGTFSTRLMTARRMLAKRLAGHGMAVASAAGVTAASQTAAMASVPASVWHPPISPRKIMTSGSSPPNGANNNPGESACHAASDTLASRVCRPHGFPRYFVWPAGPAAELCRCPRDACQEKTTSPAAQKGDRDRVRQSLRADAEDKDQQDQASKSNPNKDTGQATARFRRGDGQRSELNRVCGQAGT